MFERLFARSPAAKPRPPAEPVALTVMHDGVVYPVSVRRAAQARRYTLRFNAAQRVVVLTLPARGRMSEARAFLERNSGWVASRLAALPDHVDFAPGAVIPFRGVPHRLVHDGGRRAGVLVVEGEAGAELHVAGGVEFFARRLRDFLQREARKDLTETSMRHAASLGVKPSRISLKDTVSRWGSCSSTGALSYSWRIILAPPEVLDYLVAHEVSHLREMNHSPAFWALVKQLCPRMDRHREWLKRHGSALHHYG